MKKICLIFVLLLAATGCDREKNGGMNMVRSKIEMRTYCVGHNVIGMPSSFHPTEIATGQFKESSLGEQDTAFDVIVRQGRFSPGQFLAEVAKRRKEIVDASEEKVDVLRLEKKLNDQATLFRVQRIDDAYFSELVLLRDTNVVRVRLDSYENEFLKAEERLIALANGIKKNEEPYTRASPNGFCLGPLIFIGNFSEETGNFHYRDNLGQSFAVVMDIDRGVEESPLLTRMTGPDSLLTKFNVHHKVIRARERTVAGMRSQEWLGLAQIGEHPDDNAFGFTLETIRSNPGKAAPRIHLSFDTAQPLPDGSATKTLMSEEEALELWDSVVESIRP